MVDNNELVQLLFAELVSELGGTVKLDALTVMDSINSGRLKQIGISIEEDEITIEVFEQDE